MELLLDPPSSSFFLPPLLSCPSHSLNFPLPLPHLPTPTPSSFYSHFITFPLPDPLPLPHPTISLCIGFPTAAGVMGTVMQYAFIPAIFSCVYIVRGCGRYANPDYHVYLNAYNRARQITGNFTHEQVCVHMLQDMWNSTAPGTYKGGWQTLQYKVNPNPNRTLTLIHAVHTV